MVRLSEAPRGLRSAMLYNGAASTGENPWFPLLSAKRGYVSQRKEKDKWIMGSRMGE